MDDTSLRLDVSEGGGPRGARPEVDGHPSVALTGDHAVPRMHE